MTTENPLRIGKGVILLIDLLPHGFQVNKILVDQKGPDYRVAHLFAD